MQRNISPFQDTRAIFELASYLREMKVDIVHGHSAKGGMIARIAGRLTGCSTVYTPHAWSFGPNVSRAKSQLYATLERMAVPWTDLLINVSESEMRLGREYGIRARAKVIKNGVKLPEKVEPRPYVSGSLCLTVGFVGRLSMQKNPLFLIQLMDALRTDPVRLVVAGDGELRSQLEAGFRDKGLSDKVEILGMIDGPHAVMNRIDVLLLPSLWEGLPYVLLEGYAYGVPSLASRVVGNVDAVVEGVTGYLLDPSQPSEWVSKIRMFLSNKMTLRTMAMKAREYAEKNLSLSSMVSQIADSYEELFLARSGRPYH